MCAPPATGPSAPRQHRPLALQPLREALAAEFGAGARQDHALGECPQGGANRGDVEVPARSRTGMQCNAFRDLLARELLRSGEIRGACEAFGTLSSGHLRKAFADPGDVDGAHAQPLHTEADRAQPRPCHGGGEGVELGCPDHRDGDRQFPKGHLGGIFHPVIRIGVAIDPDDRDIDHVGRPGHPADGQPEGAGGTQRDGAKLPRPQGVCRVDHGIRPDEDLGKAHPRAQVHPAAPTRADRLMTGMGQRRHDLATQVPSAARHYHSHAPDDDMGAVARVLLVDDWVGGWPFWAVYLLFFCAAMVRSHATYAVGRGLRAGAQRTASGAQDPDKIRQRLGRRLDGPGLRRAEGLMARFGAPLVTLSFLTIGVQTLLNAAAGALRMPLRHYTPSAVLGSLVWAGLYTTAGFVVLETIQGVLPWWALLAVVAGAGVVLLVTRALRGRVRG